MKKYIYIVAAFFLVGVIAQSVYQQLNKKSAKSDRIECHKKITVFERVANKKLLPLMKQSIQKGAFKVNVTKEEAKFMESKLFAFVDPIQVKEQFLQTLGVKTFTNTNIDTVIDILIYENDKNDPGKKTAKSKLYAGYLVFSFKQNNLLVYKLQIDFMDHQGKDILKALQCAVDSFNTL